MKLKVIKQGGASARGMYVIVAKRGTVIFGRRVCQEQNLEAGDKVDFLQDEDCPRDFFLDKAGRGCELRQHGKDGALRVCHLPFAQAVSEAYGIQAPFRMQLSRTANEEGVYALVPLREEAE